MGSWVSFVQLRPGGHWVRSGSSGCAMGVVDFFQVWLVHPGAPWGSLGSFRFVCFVQERAWGRWCRSGSSGSFGCAPAVAGFLRFRVVRIDAL